MEITLYQEETTDVTHNRAATISWLIDSFDQSAAVLKIIEIIFLNENIKGLMVQLIKCDNIILWQYNKLNMYVFTVF